MTRTTQAQRDDRDWNYEMQRAANLTVAAGNARGRGNNAQADEIAAEAQVSLDSAAAIRGGRS